jgi:hypothetical protein
LPFAVLVALERGIAPGQENLMLPQVFQLSSLNNGLAVRKSGYKHQARANFLFGGTPSAINLVLMKNRSPKATIFSSARSTAFLNGV